MLNREQTISIEVLRACNWNFEKASKLQIAKDKFSNEEFDLLLEASLASNELAIGEVNESRLYKIMKFINKHQSEITVLTSLTIIMLTAGCMTYAMPTMAFVSAKAVSSTTVACASLPAFSLGSATSLANALISNLIKLGVLATVASCVFEMLKQIVEGNVNRLPKTLISHAMMCCSILLAPTVFNYISNVFNMGNIIGAAFSLLA